MNNYEYTLKDIASLVGLPCSVVETLGWDYFDQYGTCQGFCENVQVWIEEEGKEEVIRIAKKIKSENYNKYNQTRYTH
jgi:hypothetical protein